MRLLAEYGTRGWKQVVLRQAASGVQERRLIRRWSRLLLTERSASCVSPAFALVQLLDAPNQRRYTQASHGFIGVVTVGSLHPGGCRPHRSSSVTLRVAKWGCHGNENMASSSGENRGSVALPVTD